MKYTIEDLKNRKCAVINDGTLEQLKKVLKLAFPTDTHLVRGLNKIYFASTINYGLWTGNNNTNRSELPLQSVKDFLKEEIKWGDNVEAFGNTDLYYIGEHPLQKGSCILVNKSDSDTIYKTDWRIVVASSDRIKKIKEKEILELTMEEIAEKFNKSVDEIRIKK